MASTLGITQVAAAQNQKEVTINEADQALEDLTNLTTDIVITGSVTLTAAQYRSGVRFRLGGTPAGAFDLRLPANERMFFVTNNSGQTATVGVDPGADGFDGTTVAVSTGKTKLVLCDGTNCVEYVQGSPSYDFGASFEAAPAVSTVFGRVQISRNITLPANFAGSTGDVAANPTSTYAVDVQDDGVSIGTISVSTGGVFTFSTAGGTAKSVAAGSTVTFITPAGADATVAGFSAALLGSED